MKRGMSWKKKAPFMVLFVLAAIAGFSAVVMLLWNAILPDVLGVEVVNYWQAMGILVLCKILFGSFGPSKRKGKGKRRNPRCKEKIMDMTDEQEDSFKSELKSRWNKE
jgi:hypothetical protein